MVDDFHEEESKKKRKLKRRSEKEKKEDEDSEIASVSLDIEPLGDAMEVDAPESKEVAESDAVSSKALVEKYLADNLFNSDDFGEEASDAVPKRLILSTSANPNDPIQVEPVEEDILAPKKVTIVMEDSIPIEFGHYDSGQVRCVYAANPTSEGWSPIEIEPFEEGSKQEEALRDVRYDERAICSPIWGVFTVHSGDTDAQKRRKNRNQLDAVDSNSVETMSDTHWFILLGPDSVMKLIASPFFTSTVRVVRVERRRIKFAWSKQVPIFYVYGLVSKIPLWPKDENWKPNQLMRLLCDTLYAHVELKCKRSGDEVQACVRKVLSTVEAFPMVVNKPSESCLAPAQVPINNYSTRKERVDHLKKFIVSPYKIATNTIYATTTIQDTKNLLGCLTTLITPADFLLVDLEKPSDIWETIVDKFGVPVSVVSEATNWKLDRQDGVISKLKVFTRLAEMNQLDKESPILLRDLYQVAANIAFSPEWFDGWFNFARRRDNRAERLELYAFFAATALWAQILREAERFGSISTFLLTKAKQAYIFDQGYLWADAECLLSIRLAGAKDVRESHVPLTAEEKVTVMENIVTHFKALNAAKQPSPFVIQHDRFSSITSTAAINADRYKMSIQLAKLILQICVLFANVKQTIQPAALASIPPLFVQSSSIYGKKTDNDPHEFHQQILALCDSKAHVLIITSKRSIAELAPDLQKVNQPNVVIFDDFHNWSMSQIGYVVNVLQQTNRLDKCTHLIVMGYTHTLGYINGGSALLWELLEVAERLETLMGFKKSSSSESNVGNLVQVLKSTRFQPLYPGVGMARGDIFYTVEDRRNQITANEKVLLFHESKSLNHVCRFLLGNIERKGKLRTAFLAARFTSLKQIRVLLSSQNYNLFNTKPSLFEFYTFHAIETDPLLLQAFDYIVFVDLDYKGAGRVNFMHFNAAFEHAKRGILFVSDLADVDKYDVSNHFDDLFMNNDIKSERHLLNIGRCPVLRDHFFDKYLNNEKVQGMLKHETTRKAKVSDED